MSATSKLKTLLMMAKVFIGLLLMAGVLAVKSIVEKLKSLLS